MIAKIEILLMVTVPTRLSHQK